MTFTVLLASLVACSGGEEAQTNAAPQANNAPMQPAPGPGGTPYNAGPQGPPPQGQAANGAPAGQGGGPRGGEAPPVARQTGQTNSGQPLPSGGGEATDTQIAAAIQRHIQIEIQAMGGKFLVSDPETESELVLQFVELKGPVKKVSGAGYFGYADFRVDGGEEGQLYEMGFWVRVDGGNIMVTRQRITREPVKDGSSWQQEVLYTNDAEWPDLLE